MCLCIGVSLKRLRSLSVVVNLLFLCMYTENNRIVNHATNNITNEYVALLPRLQNKIIMKRWWSNGQAICETLGGLASWKNHDTVYVQIIMSTVESRLISYIICIIDLTFLIL